MHRRNEKLNAKNVKSHSYGESGKKVRHPFEVRCIRVLFQFFKILCVLSVTGSLAMSLCAYNNNRASKKILFNLSRLD